MMNGYFVGLGSNVEPARNVPNALEHLLRTFGSLNVSRIIQTSPVGRMTAPFINLVAFFKSELEGHQLKDLLCRVETEFGRDRADPDRAHKDRSLDLDILLSLPNDARQIRSDLLPSESYYRSSTLELLHSMGYSCPLPGELPWNALEVPLAGTKVGLKPVRLSVDEGQRAVVHQRRAALITGAAVRVGYSIATTLARSGFDIAMHYNTSRAAAECSAEKIRSFGVRCDLFQQDLAQTDGIAALVRKVTGCFPHLDVLVNSASVYEKARISETTPKMLDEQWSINFRAPFFLIKEFASQVEHGSIINILDNKIAFNQFQYAAYLSAKKSLGELTKMAALEFAPGSMLMPSRPG